MICLSWSYVASCYWTKLFKGIIIGHCLCQEKGPKLRLTRAQKAANKLLQLQYGRVPKRSRF
ncbi:hypothetical protein L484_014356 [Morus notabilis]|uniref:Uncharacterized protein n=1 Tax=Morus notabilis TaxID=981085 RepID=W9RKF5_9ROSA|nr:hypothetical protein L484_014356 [Morus notabilis]